MRGEALKNTEWLAPLLQCGKVAGKSKITLVNRVRAEYMSALLKRNYVFSIAVNNSVRNEMGLTSSFREMRCLDDVFEEGCEAPSSLVAGSSPVLDEKQFESVSLEGLVFSKPVIDLSKKRFVNSAWAREFKSFHLPSTVQEYNYCRCGSAIGLQYCGLPHSIDMLKVASWDDMLCGMTKWKEMDNAEIERGNASIVTLVHQPQSLTTEKWDMRDPSTPFFVFIKELVRAGLLAKSIDPWKQNCDKGISLNDLLTKSK